MSEYKSNDAVPSVILNDRNSNEEEFEKQLNIISSIGDRKKRTQSLMTFLTQFSATTRIKLKNRVCLFDANYISTLIKTDLKGDAEDIAELLFLPIDIVRAQFLGKFLDKEKKHFIPHYCALTNTEIKILNNAYTRVFKRSLLEDMKKEFKKDIELINYILLPIANRPISQMEANQTNCQKLATNLKLLLENKKIDLVSISTIFAQNSLIDIQYMYQLLQKENYALHGELEKVKKESKYIYEAIIAILDISNSKYGFFCQQFVKSMKGMGTDEDLLNYLVLTRSETDLATICKAFPQIPQAKKQSLEKWITDDTKKGMYRELLLGLCGVLKRQYPVSQKTPSPKTQTVSVQEANQLKQQVQKLTQENERLGSELQSFQKQNETLSKQVNSLVKTNDENEDDENELRNQINTLNRQNQDLTQQVKNLQSKINTVEDVKNTEYVHVETTKNNDNQLQQMLVEKQGLTKERNDLVEEKNELTKRVNTLDSRLDEKDKQLEELKKQLQNGGVTPQPKSGSGGSNLLFIVGLVVGIGSGVVGSRFLKN